MKKKHALLIGFLAVFATVTAAAAEGGGPGEGKSPKKLTAPPDGTFTGRFRSADISGEIKFIVRAGIMMAGEVKVEGKKIHMRLVPTGLPDSPDINLGGNNDLDYFRLFGAFLDEDRAAGRFRGNLARYRVSGQWYAIKR